MSPTNPPNTAYTEAWGNFEAQRKTKSVLCGDGVATDVWSGGNNRVLAVCRVFRVYCAQCAKICGGVKRRPKNADFETCFLAAMGFSCAVSCWITALDGASPRWHKPAARSAIRRPRSGRGACLEHVGGMAGNIAPFCRTWGRTVCPCALCGHVASRSRAGRTIIASIGRLVGQKANRSPFSGVWSGSLESPHTTFLQAFSGGDCYGQIVEKRGWCERKSLWNASISAQYVDILVFVVAMRPDAVLLATHTRKTPRPYGRLVGE